MYVVQRPQIVTTTSHTCGFHKRHPGRPFPGCTCSGSIGSRDKTDAEMTEEERRWYYAALIGERPDGSSLF